MPPYIITRYPFKAASEVCHDGSLLQGTLPYMTKKDENGVIPVLYDF